MDGHIVSQKSGVGWGSSPLRLPLMGSRLRTHVFKMTVMQNNLVEDIEKYATYLAPMYIFSPRIQHFVDAGLSCTPFSRLLYFFFIFQLSALLRGTSDGGTLDLRKRLISGLGNMHIELRLSGI